MRWDGNEFYAKNNQFYARPHKGPFLWYATKERVCSTNSEKIATIPLRIAVKCGIMGMLLEIMEVQEWDEQKCRAQSMKYYNVPQSFS